MDQEPALKAAGYAHVRVVPVFPALDLLRHAGLFVVGEVDDLDPSRGGDPGRVGAFHAREVTGRRLVRRWLVRGRRQVRCSANELALLQTEIPRVRELAVGLEGSEPVIGLELFEPAPRCVLAVQSEEEIRPAA